MKLYLILGIALIIGIISFYHFAYHLGYQNCHYQSTQKALAFARQNTQAQIQTQTELNHLKSQLERKKSHDKTCADILQFDIDRCL